MSFQLRVLRRIVFALLVGLVSGFLISEVSFLFLRESNREPMVIELEIPAGTADQIAQGIAPPGIPDEMRFVVGDTLLVRNNDQTDHQLGPLWIPPGSTATMNLDRKQNFVFACSFQPSNYFGLDVREPVTIWTRLGGVIFSGVPLGALLALYSLITWPIKKEPEDPN